MTRFWKWLEKSRVAIRLDWGNVFIGGEPSRYWIVRLEANETWLWVLRWSFRVSIAVLIIAALVAK